jgi:hypothetical protein
MNTQTIAYGPMHAAHLLKFAGYSYTEIRNSKTLFRYVENEKQWRATEHYDGRVMWHYENTLAGYSRVTMFDNRAEYDAWFKENDPRGSYDIENGNAPFGHQRSPLSK